ncbi:MAG: SRPBCC domain-containing protein [Psychromonas sp.]|nr:SRPBCC domain-containing protein [Psychromonas sp.]
MNKQIIINAPKSTIFDALTIPEKIMQYFPLKQVKGDWKVGGKVEYIREIGGITSTDFTYIEVLDKPSRFQYSYWNHNHGTENRPENHLTICYQLSKHENGTLLSLTQSNIQNPKMYKQMNTTIWDYLLGTLKEFAENKNS